ncbi:A/G-specific adenine glycosylase [Hyphococcus luteus]|uniref:A/G-specific adenine glycosylase n=1 Tax=Hyphococcus luteus TaxID=2058213 RepID=UPI001A9C8AA2|nr:A/G-specific adenine glycosylase [Marinicaulis flavus]
MTRKAAKLPPIPQALLRWYDANARDLPWRVAPKARKAGARPDPYAVWLSEIMLQQTTVATVAPRYREFLTRWPDVKAMAAAPLDDVLGEWAGLGYYARARNLHKCAVTVAETHGGFFPDTEEALRALPGIGAYTAAAIAAIAFDRRAIVIDGNIERVVSRLYAIDTPLPAAKAEIREKLEEIWPQKRSGDFAQGLMDLGASICRPKAPICLLCPVSSRCKAFKAGTQGNFPVKPAKKAKPNRVGAVFALVNAKGEMLFERRPEKGLLGGMLGLPGTEWKERIEADVFNAAPAQADWEKTGEATHTFTHFHLTLDVYAGAAPKGFRRASDQQWIKPEEARLPTVMKKAVGAATPSPSRA